MTKNRNWMIFIFSIYAEKSLESESKFCDKTELPLPENAKWWTCDSSFENNVAKGGRCYLECAQFFKASYCM